MFFEFAFRINFGGRMCSQKSRQIGIGVREWVEVKVVATCIALICTRILQVIIKHEIFDTLLLSPFGFLLIAHGNGKLGIRGHLDIACLYKCSACNVGWPVSKRTCCLPPFLVIKEKAIVLELGGVAVPSLSLSSPATT